MASLNDLENAQVPGVGSVDVTDPSSHIKLVTGMVALVGGYGIAQFIVNKLKSSSGVQEVKDQLPEV